MLDSGVFHDPIMAMSTDEALFRSEPVSPLQQAKLETITSILK